MQSKRRSPLSSRTVSRARRLNRVLDLMTAGKKNQRQIAEQEEVSSSQICYDVKELKGMVGPGKRQAIEAAQAKHTSREAMSKRIRQARAGISEEEELRRARKISTTLGVGPEKIARILDALNTGKAFEEIGREEGVSANLVGTIDRNRKRYAQLAGVEHNGAPRTEEEKAAIARETVTKHPVETRELALSYIRAGKSFAETEAMLSEQGQRVNRNTVRTWAIEAGLHSPRIRGERGNQAIFGTRSPRFEYAEKAPAIEKHFLQRSDAGSFLKVLQNHYPTLKLDAQTLNHFCKINRLGVLSNGRKRILSKEDMVQINRAAAKTADLFTSGNFVNSQQIADKLGITRGAVNAKLDRCSLTVRNPITGKKELLPDKIPFIKVEKGTTLGATYAKYVFPAYVADEFKSITPRTAKERGVFGKKTETGRMHEFREKLDGMPELKILTAPQRAKAFATLRQAYEEAITREFGGHGEFIEIWKNVRNAINEALDKWDGKTNLNQFVRFVVKQRLSQTISYHNALK